MASIADDEPPPATVLAEYVDVGRAWVAVEAERLAGYLIADLVDGNVHVEQVSVHPRSARRGVGRRLIEEAARYAERVGAPALTLTTFADVPWNAPYYRRCGFAVLSAEAIGDELRAVRAHEAEIGLDRWPRVCMGRTIDSRRPSAEP